jgi:hypothetical protein
MKKFKFDVTWDFEEFCNKSPFFVELILKNFKILISNPKNSKINFLILFSFILTCHIH